MSNYAGEVVETLTMSLLQVKKLEPFLYYPVTFLLYCFFALVNNAIVLPVPPGNIFSSAISFGVLYYGRLQKSLLAFLLSYS